MGRGYAPDELAVRLKISRAALYRVEKGDITKIGLLNAIASELEVSLPTLLGVGLEYISNVLTFFERMRQTEEGCSRIIGLFSPVSYLLTSRAYDKVLADVLIEAISAGSDADALVQTVDRLLHILRRRKETYQRERPQIVSIVSSLDLERLLRDGLEGRSDLPPGMVAHRRRMALQEVRHIVGLLRSQAIGIQIGVAREPIPATSFQVVRNGGTSTLTVSPFRLGQQPNIQNGVGIVTSAPEAVDLHEGIARRLWESSLKSIEAADHLEKLIARFGIVPARKPRNISLKSENRLDNET